MRTEENRFYRIIDVDRDNRQVAVNIGRNRVRDRRRRMEASPVVLPRVRERLAAAGTAAEIVEVLDDANDLFPIGWLRAGLLAARSVGRIEGNESGTATLVSPRLLLTNHHVLETQAIAAPAVIVMDDELDAAGRQRPGVRYRLHPGRFFVTDAKLDFTLVAVSTSAAKRFGFQRMIREVGKVIEGDHVTIIQHPSAGPKEIAFRQNRVTKILRDVIHYQTDTLRGSSGSPVFNDQWELVAVHHDGVARVDARGRWLDRDCQPAGLDPERVHWIANEGTRVSKILAAVGRAEVAPAWRPYIEELMLPPQTRAES